MNEAEILNLQSGDTLKCLWNTGSYSVGDILTIWGITENSINISGSTTGWRSKEDFRFRCFELNKKVNILPEKIKEFLEKVEKIRKSNKVLLEKRKIELMATIK